MGDVNPVTPQPFLELSENVALLIYLLHGAESFLRS